jgi:hypothetical protein
MKTLRRLALPLFLLLTATCGLAQGGLPLDRLPPDTFFYVAWRGESALAAGNTNNSLVRLWSDPEFTSLRQSLAESILASSRTTAKPGEKEPEKEPPLTGEEIEMGLRLLGNPAVIGWAGLPDFSTLFSSAGQPRKASERGLFLIYDTTGKAELLDKFNAALAARRKQKPIESTYTFQGVTVTKSTSQNGADFDARVGNYWISSDRQDVAEALITRLTAATPPATSLSGTRTYQAARNFIGTGSLFELYVRFPDFTKIPATPAAAGFDFPAMLRALHVERMHGLAASVKLAGEATQFRWALLGDTSPGSLFDIFADSSASFATLASAPAGASFSATRFDLVRIYQTLRGALRAGLPPHQFSNIELVEGSIGSEMRMGIVDILGLFAGEFAMVELDPATSVDISNYIFVFTIRNHEEVLRLAHLLMASHITSEDSEGGATYLAVALPYTDPKTGAQRSRFHYFAVTPQMLVVGPRKAQVRETLRRLEAAASAPAGTPPAAGLLAGDPVFVRNRGQLPATLSAVGFTDMSKFPWESIFAEAVKQFQAQAQAQGKAAPAPPPDWLSTVPRLLWRYFHTFTSGWWKERGGVFMEVRID